MPDVIRTRRDGGILEVILDRPKANAIDLATSRLLGETFKAFRDDPELRVAIVATAGDKFFSAGWDLKAAAGGDAVDGDYRSEEHTSELQSLMRSSYAVFCLKKTKHTTTRSNT